jgi:hypothetical protein
MFAADMGQAKAAPHLGLRPCLGSYQEAPHGPKTLIRLENR